MLCRAAVGFVLLFAACGGSSDPPGDGIDAEIEQQLEENRKALPNDTPTARRVRGRSLEAFVRDYQAAGFFKGDSAQAIRVAFEREWDEPPPLATRADELMLLGYDRERVWYEDIERDVIEGNDAYVEAFREWSGIAAGAFEPRDVSEAWAGEEGPVTIAFRLGGRRHEIKAAGQGDFLDLCVLTAGINPLIEETGRQFAVYRPDAMLGQRAFVVAITPRERAALQAREWVFATPDEVRQAFGYGQLYEDGTAGSCG
jgi:hypothetical protein